MSERGARPPAPDPLPIPVVDNHTHLDMARDGDEPPDLAAVIEAATAVGVPRMVQIGCDLPGARRLAVSPGAPATRASCLWTPIIGDCR